MTLLPKDVAEFSSADYWERFFNKRKDKAFEWYGDYSQLCGQLHRYIKLTDRVLVIGCGNSTLSADMYNVGFKQLESIDISAAVVAQMRAKYAALCHTPSAGSVSHNEADRGGARLVFRCMDARHLLYRNAQMSCVLDKGTLDALLTDSLPDTVQSVEQMFSEIERVLCVGGRYVCVSLLQPHVVAHLTDWFSRRGFLVRVCRCPEAESTSPDSVSFPVYVVVCTKFVQRIDQKPILEACLGGGADERARRVHPAAALLRMIDSQQRFAFLCHATRRRHDRQRCDVTSATDDDDDVTLELCAPHDDSQLTRYTLHILDARGRRRRAKRAFAIFIVPHGRETEYIFGTSAGRRQLLATIDHDRVIVVELHAAQHYASMSDIQQELSPHVMQLKPAHLADNVQVPFMTAGDDLGHRRLRHRGHTSLSGDFIVEDVFTSNPSASSGSASGPDSLRRRLVFLANRNMVQSEVRLLPASRDDVADTDQSHIIDSHYLCCDHHRYMALAVVAALNNIDGRSVTGIDDRSVAGIDGANTRQPRVLVIGIGGGLLITFLRRKFRQLVIDAVDIDGAIVDIARDWFGFCDDVTDDVTVHITDGVQFIEQSVSNQVDEGYDAVIVDVDSKQVDSGMSGPPRQFVQPGLLEHIHRLLLLHNGVFALNLAARSEELRSEVHDNLATVFAPSGNPGSCLCYQLPDQINQVVFCGGNNLRERLRQAAIDFNRDESYLSSRPQETPSGKTERGAGRKHVAATVATSVGEFVNVAEFMSRLVPIK